MPPYVIFTDKTLIEMAQTRPQDLDAMARISGVGAVKLERYGADFLAIITGESSAKLHPARRKLAGQAGADLYDQLLECQAGLYYGADNTEKPLSCTAAQIAKIAQMRPRDAQSLSRILDEKRIARFGDAFLEILRTGG